MSRGHGRVERAVLDAVAQAPVYDGLPMSRIAAAVYGTEEPTRSQMVSLRRAVKRLEEQRLVYTLRSPAAPTPGRSYWRRTGRTVLCQGEAAACSYCAAGHTAWEEPPDMVHTEYAQVRSVIESWVRKHPQQYTAEEAAEAERRRAEALQQVAALERLLR